MNSWNPYKTLNLQKLEESELFQCSENKLREDRWFKPVLDYVEDLTKVNRVYSVSALGAILAGIVLLQYGTALIVGCVGFVLPAYKTVGDLDKSDKDLLKSWVLYWTVFSALQFFEILLFFLTYIPGYWFFKSAFLIWCFQRHGSEIVYHYLLHPLFQTVLTISKESDSAHTDRSRTPDRWRSGEISRKLRHENRCNSR